MSLSCTILRNWEEAQDPVTTSGYIWWWGGRAKSDGKRGVDRGRCGSIAGDLRTSRRHPITGRTLPLARPHIQAEPANQRTGRPVRLPPSPPRTGAASLTGRTAWALFSPNPGHHASAAMCLDSLDDAQQVRGHFTHLGDLGGQWDRPQLQRQCRPGRPLDTTPGSPAQLLCLNSRYIPSRGPLTRSVCPAVRHLP